MFTIFPRLLNRREQVVGPRSGGEQQTLAICGNADGRTKRPIDRCASFDLLPIVVDECWNRREKINRRLVWSSGVLNGFNRLRMHSACLKPGGLCGAVLAGKLPGTVQLWTLILD